MNQVLQDAGRDVGMARLNRVERFAGENIRRTVLRMVVFRMRYHHERRLVGDEDALELCPEVGAAVTNAGRESLVRGRLFARNVRLRSGAAVRQITLSAVRPR